MKGDPMNQTRCLLALTMCVLLTSTVRMCTAATFTCGAGDVACLIASITAANGTPAPDSIHLAGGTYQLTAVDNTTNGPNGLPSVTSPLTLQGVGAAQTVIVRVPGAPMFRLLHVAPTGALTVQGLTITGGDVGNFMDGGGIWNVGTLVVLTSAVIENRANFGGGLINGGQVTIERSEFVRNTAVHAGGGLDNGGVVTVRESTFAENSADGGGAMANVRGTVLITNSTIVDNIGVFSGAGGIVNLTTGGVLRLTNTTMARNTGLVRGGGGGGALSVVGGEALLTNCTIVENTAPDGGAPGGIVRTAGVLALHNTIVARNIGPRSGDCGGVITSEGHNLISDPAGCTIALHPTDLTGDPDVDAYADDGQPGHGSYPLLATSRAIDAGDDATCPLTDQLGNPRVGPCDIGAVEFQPARQPPALAMRLNQATFQPGQTLRMDVELRNPGPMLTTDAYLGVILPDGQSVLWLTNTAPLEGVVTSLNNPATFVPILRGVSWPEGLEAVQRDYLTYTFNGGEEAGTYHLLVGWTTPGSLEDGRIDEGDILALAWVPIQVTGGSHAGLYATRQR
jgi:hypothetical protein